MADSANRTLSSRACAATARQWLCCAGGSGDSSRLKYGSVGAVVPLAHAQQLSVVTVSVSQP